METSVPSIENSITLTYPEMSPPLLETVMRLTIEKVKAQRCPPQSLRPSVGSEYQSKRPIPFARAKNNSFLRTLLIIQIGRKTSKLLSVINQPEVCQSAGQVSSTPQSSPEPRLEEPQLQSGIKRRSSHDKGSESEEKSAITTEERSNSSGGPSLKKSACLEMSRVHSSQFNSGEIGPIGDPDQLPLQIPPNSYNKKPCPGCQCCSMWMQQQNQETSTFQFYEPVRQC